MKIKGQEFFVSNQKVQSVVFVVALHVVIAVNSYAVETKFAHFPKTINN